MGEKAKSIIENIIKDVEVGEVYEGTVTKIMKFGAFVDVLNGKEGLLHISQIDNKRINEVEDVLKTGDKVTVKVIGIDNDGKIDLSRKVLLANSDDDNQEKSEGQQHRRQRYTRDRSKND